MYCGTFIYTMGTLWEWQLLTIMIGLIVLSIFVNTQYMQYVLF